MLFAPIKNNRRYKNIPKKNMNYIQAKRKYPNLNPFGDADRDGVMNMFDCKPFNRRRQDEEYGKKLPEKSPSHRYAERMAAKKGKNYFALESRKQRVTDKMEMEGNKRREAQEMRDSGEYD